MRRSLDSLLIPAMLVIGGAFAVACGSSDSTSPKADNYAVTLNGANEVPVVSTSATGTASFNFLGDTAVTYSITLHNIDSVTNVHIHAGDAGSASGMLIVEMYTNATGSGAVDGLLTSSQFNAAGLASATMSIDSLRSLARKGLTYVQVHTKAHPNGEIRGQLVR